MPPAAIDGGGIKVTHAQLRTLIALNDLLPHCIGLIYISVIHT